MNVCSRSSRLKIVRCISYACCTNKEFIIIIIIIIRAPLSIGSAMDASLQIRLSELKRVANRLHLIPAHDSLILPKASCGSLKLTHTLRSSPCANHNILLGHRCHLRSCLINISNVNINDLQWQQASLPIKAGGLGIRNVKSIASPAFLASVSKTKQLQNCLLSRCSNVYLDYHYDFYLDDSCKNNQPIQYPVGM